MRAGAPKNLTARLPQRRLLSALLLALACTSERLYYVHSELPALEGKDYLAVGPGPWPKNQALAATQDTVPDELVIRCPSSIDDLWRTGVQWRYLPHDFPDWQSVYSYFRQWKKDGTLKLIHDVLRGKVRKKAGRSPQPTAAILDSQSVKADVQAETRGYDANKKVKGLKRQACWSTRWAWCWWHGCGDDPTDAGPPRLSALPQHPLRSLAVPSSNPGGILH